MVEQKNNVVSIRSPLQLMGAIEYLLSERQCRNFLLVRLNDKDKKNTRQQIQACLKNFPKIFDKVVVWEDGNKNESFLIVDNLKKWIVAQGDNKIRVVWCQPNDTRNKILYCQLQPEEIVHVDDGTATIRHIDNDKCFYIPKFGWRGKLARFLPGSPFYNPFKIFHKSKVSWVVFSFFDESLVLKNARVHRFSSISELFDIEKKLPSSLVWIIGSPYSEVSLMPLEDEIDILRKARNYFWSKELCVVYISHRYDSEDKLTKIQELGVKCQNPNSCIELEYLVCSNPPATIASIGSTALVTLSKMQSKTDLVRLVDEAIPVSLSNNIDQQFFYVSGLNILNTGDYANSLER